MSTRWILVAALVCSCGGDDGRPTIVLSDAALDASPDAAPDAPAASMEITDACTHVCDRIAECMIATTACLQKCSADLGDCTASQVTDVDACSQAQCGQGGLDLLACLQQIACVDG